MGKVPIRLKEVVYTLSPFEQSVMNGLWKDLPHKAAHHAHNVRVKRGERRRRSAGGGGRHCLRCRHCHAWRGSEALRCSMQDGDYQHLLGAWVAFACGNAIAAADTSVRASALVLTKQRGQVAGSTQRIRPNSVHLILLRSSHPQQLVPAPAAAAIPAPQSPIPLPAPLTSAAAGRRPVLRAAHRGHLLVLRRLQGEGEAAPPLLSCRRRQRAVPQQHR